MLRSKHTALRPTAGSTVGGQPSGTAFAGWVTSIQRSTAEPARREYTHALIAEPTAIPTSSPIASVARRC